MIYMAATGLGVRMRSFRFWLTFAGSAVALASVLLILGVWLKQWRLGLPPSADEVTRINTIVTASAYGAAILAVVFALVAYWQASGRPSLKPEITFTNHSPDDFYFIAIDMKLPPWVNTQSRPFAYSPLKKEQAKQKTGVIDTGGPELLANITLTNATKYSARNPGVRVEFDGLLFQTPSLTWTVAERWPNWNGMKSIQWMVALKTSFTASGHASCQL